VGDLARMDARDLARRFGAFGLRLADLARGRDDRPVEPGEPRKSLSAETTFADDLDAFDDLTARLWPLCETVARRIRAEALAGRVVTLKLRRADFQIVTRRVTLAVATETARTIYGQAREMLRSMAPGVRYRLIGVGLSDFVETSGRGNGALFATAEARSLEGEKAVDALRLRFGDAAVIRGSALPH
jgi:DNA polymerase-4